MFDQPLWMRVTRTTAPRNRCPTTRHALDAHALTFTALTLTNRRAKRWLGTNQSASRMGSLDCTAYCNEFGCVANAGAAGFARARNENEIANTVTN